MTNRANQAAVYTDHNGHALQGHDPVAYFTVGTPTKGDPNISLEWNNATWCFATATNRDLFEADPLAYAPAFGGHCAVGTALGLRLPGSAKRWRIKDDRLYINKNLLADAQFRLFARRIHKLADRADRRAEEPTTIEESSPIERPAATE